MHRQAFRFALGMPDSYFFFVYGLDAHFVAVTLGTGMVRGFHVRNVLSPAGGARRCMNACLMARYMPLTGVQGFPRYSARFPPRCTAPYDHGLFLGDPLVKDAVRRTRKLFCSIQDLRNAMLFIMKQVPERNSILENKSRSIDSFALLSYKAVVYALLEVIAAMTGARVEHPSRRKR